ncbi:replication initiator protein [Microviridae sp.]|nr:replication initiator protein [Microviridae sp.]
MPCFNPLRGWRSKTVNPSGKRSIVFNRNQGYDDLVIELPCGQCIGCRLERSRQWAIRCLHEASLYDDNCFLTLTYSDVNLPIDGSLNKEHFQKFMKRLRKKYPRLPGNTIRYFHCGEYGEKLNRPHYHACLFNIDFTDKVLWKNKNGFKLYTSESLSQLWPYGYCIIGNVTFESAAYVARYIMKKITGDQANDHYQGRSPEYITMSRRPGIGKAWYDKFKDDLFPHDKCIINGKETTIPKFYYNLLELDDSKLNFLLKAVRKKQAMGADDATLRRLLVKEQCLEARLTLLERTLEQGEL